MDKNPFYNFYLPLWVKMSLYSAYNCLVFILLYFQLSKNTHLLLGIKLFHFSFRVIVNNKQKLTKQTVPKIFKSRIFLLYLPNNQ